MKTVIFGGTGFIGGHLARALVAADQSVSFTGSQRQLPAEMLQDVETAFYLTHIGSSGGADATDQDLAEMMEANQASLRSAFQAVQKTARHFVFLSSGGTVYGKTSETPAREDQGLSPISAYGKIKKSQEELLHRIAISAGVPYTIIRPSNVYGRGQKNNLIAAVIEQLTHQKTIQIYGDQGVVRDFLYIDDIVQALQLLNGKEGEGRVYNIGTGVATATLSLVYELAKLLSVQAPRIEFLPARMGDVPYNVLNSGAFQKRYSWKPSHALAQGLALTATQRT